MNEKTYKELIEKLNSKLNINSEPNLSHLRVSGLFGGNNFQEVLSIITPNINIESLSNNNLYLLHTLLHKFYAVGKNKRLSKSDIKNLHSKVSKKILHSNFDKLDEE